MLPIGAETAVLAISKARFERETCRQARSSPLSVVVG
jgi:hypothetical protein